MLETLQGNEGTNAESVTLIRPNELIIDDKYCNIVRDFVNGAKGEIRICSYAWRWYENEPSAAIQGLNVALLLAMSRGVKIRVLADSQIVRDKLRALGFDARGVEKNRMMHTKAFCIDMTTLVIGSHNMTKRANTDNYEMSIATQEFAVIDQFCTYFDGLWAARG